MIDRKVIGEGTYGCVIEPSLECKKKGMDYTNKVSKVMRKKDAVEELGEFDKIKNIKGIEEFILKPPELCNLKKDMNFVKAVSQCNTKNVRDTYKTKPNNLVALVMENGGVSVSDFKKNVYEHLNIQQKTRFLTSFLHLFKGLIFFSNNDIIHHDLSLRNIVYNAFLNKIYFIDFGLMQSKSEVIKKAKISKDSWGVSHGYYAPETSCRNKNWFDSHKCKKYKNDFTHDSFLEQTLNTFDSYTLSYFLKDMFSFLSIKTKEFIGFFDDAVKLMELYCDEDPFIRSSDLNKLYIDYKSILQRHNIMEKSIPSIPTTVSEITFQSARSKIVEDDYDIDSIFKKTPDFMKDSEFSEKVVELIEKHSNNVNKCKPTQDYNPNTKKCVAKCKDGKVRNAKFRCVKQKTSKIKNANNSTKKKEKCAELNKDYNPKTKRCVKKCKSTQKRNSDFKCVSNK